MMNPEQTMELTFMHFMSAAFAAEAQGKKDATSDTDWLVQMGGEDMITPSMSYAVHRVRQVIPVRSSLILTSEEDVTAFARIYQDAYAQVSYHVRRKGA